MNTTYKSSVKPQFEGLQPQDATLDLSQPRQMLESLGKGLEQEAKTLQDIALDEAQIEFNRGAAQLVDKYGSDFQGLDKAMMKLEESSYQKFAQRNPALATKLLKQQDAVRLRAVDAARKTYIKTNNEKIRYGSGALLDSFKMAMPDDFANYLYQKTLPEEEQDIDVIGQWENNIQQIDQLLNRRDMEGNYIFSETDRKNRADLNKYKMQGAKTFVDGMDSEQLKKWDSDTFQNEKAFREMTGFDKDEYNQLDTYVKNRRKALDKDDERIIKTQAMFNTADLIKNGNDEAKIDELRKNTNAPKALVERAVKLNDEIIKTHWYDPDKDTDPSGLFGALAEMDEILKDNDGSPDSLKKKIEKGLDIVETVVKNNDKLNMSDKDIQRVRDWVSNSIADSAFRNDIKEMGITEWAIQMHPTCKGGAKAQDLVAMANRDKSNILSLPFATALPTKVYDSRRNANNNAARAIVEALGYYERTGNKTAARNMVVDAKYNYVKDINDYWISNNDFDRLQQEFKDGKKPTYFYNGILWKYNGINGDKAIFEATI